jgi:hypothetical protein
MSEKIRPPEGGRYKVKRKGGMTTFNEKLAACWMTI